MVEPNQLSSLKTEVLALLDQGQGVAAEAKLLACLNTHGESALLYHLLGLVAYQRSQLPQALAYLRKAKTLAENDVEISLSLAATLCELGDYPQAEKIFTSVNLS